MLCTVPAHNVTPIADFRPTLADVLTRFCTALSSNLKPMLEASTAARPHEDVTTTRVSTSTLGGCPTMRVRHVLHALPRPRTHRSRPTEIIRFGATDLPDIRTLTSVGG
jgi:hypothetical protein